PADADQSLEEILFERRREAVQRERVLADVRMDPQGEVCARVAQAVIRRQRNRDVVADAVDVDDDAVGMLLEDSAAQVGNQRTLYCRQLAGAFRGAAPITPATRAGACEWTWQIATASASAASCGDGAAARPRM